MEGGAAPGAGAPGREATEEQAGDRRIALLLGAFGAAIYLVATIGHTTDFDYFGRLAEAFVQGRYWLDDAPAHLNELVSGVGGHRYSVVPPLPAILLVPLVPFGDPGQTQTFLSAVAGGASAAPLYLALRALAVTRRIAIAAVVLSTFGTTLWISAADGRSWFAADAIEVLVMSLTLWAAAAGAPSLLVGAGLGAAALARLPLVLAAPGLLLLMHQRRRPGPRALSRTGAPAPGASPPFHPPRALRDLALFAAGMAPFIGLEALYNLARWGTPMEAGYGILSADDPFYARGLFSLSYVPRHIYAMLFEPPSFVDGELLFLRARSVGMSMLFATPAFLWLARAPLLVRSFPAAGALLLACLPLLPDVTFGTVGFEQYGYRRSLDVQVFLIALVAVAAGWEGDRWARRPSPLFLAAVVLSVLVTLYFLVTIRIYGFAK